MSEIDNQLLEYVRERFGRVGPPGLSATPPFSVGDRVSYDNTIMYVTDFDADSNAPEGYTMVCTPDFARVVRGVPPAMVVRLPQEWWDPPGRNPAISKRGHRVYRGGPGDDAMDMAMAAVRCGQVPQGAVIYVFAGEGDGMRRMRAGTYAGCPALEDLGPAPCGIRP